MSLKKQCTHCKKTTTISGRLAKYGEPKYCMHCGSKLLLTPDQLAEEVKQGRLTPNEARRQAGFSSLPDPRAEKLFIIKND